MGAESTTMPATNSMFDNVSEWVTEKAEYAKDFVSDPVGTVVDDKVNSFIDKYGDIAGGAGGGILGWNLGGALTGDSTIGKIAFGVLGVWFGGSYGKEIMNDIKSAIDYAKNNTDENEGFMGYVKNFGTAVMGNFSVKDGQMYNGDGIIERADGKGEGAKSAVAEAIENGDSNAVLTEIDKENHNSENDPKQARKHEEATNQLAEATVEKGIAEGDMETIAAGLAADHSSTADLKNTNAWYYNLGLGNIGRAMGAKKAAELEQQQAEAMEGLNAALAEKASKFDAVVGADTPSEQSADSPDYGPDA